MQPTTVVVRLELFCVQRIIEYMRMKPIKQEATNWMMNIGLVHSENDAIFSKSPFEYEIRSTRGRLKKNKYFFYNL